MLNRRKLLKAGAAALFIPPAIVRPAKALLKLRGGPVDNGYPGQPSNLVGYANAPGFPGFGAPVSIGTSLILSNSSTVSYKDIVPQGVRGGQVSNVINTNGITSNGGGGAAVHDITFVGCRFTGQSWGQTNMDTICDLYTCGSTNITFSYCTFAPPVALNPTPIPALAWPSSSVGQGNQINSSVYMTPWVNSARDCVTVNIPVGTTVTFDHCDIWGCAEIIGISGNVWTGANNPISGVNGTLTVSNCWLHDNRLPIAPTWSSGSNYSINDFASGSDFNNYIAAMASGPGHGGAVNPVGDVSGHWTFFSTFDHGNGIIATNSNGASNVTVNHCTISGLGNTDNITFSHLQTVGTFWQAGSSYVLNDGVGASDGFFYAALRSSTGVNPAGNTHTLDWSQFGFNGYQNMVVRNCWISGFEDGIDLGIGNSGQTGITFEDNVISNDVMWGARLCAVTGVSGAGPYSPDQTGMFTSAPTNSWRRNTYNAYPGSGAWDPDHYLQGGQYVWPGSGSPSFSGTSINPTDWPNS